MRITLNPAPAGFLDSRIISYQYYNIYCCRQVVFYGRLREYKQLTDFPGLDLMLKFPLFWKNGPILCMTATSFLDVSPRTVQFYLRCKLFLLNHNMPILFDSVDHSQLLVNLGWISSLYFINKVVTKCIWRESFFLLFQPLVISISYRYYTKLFSIKLILSGLKINLMPKYMRNQYFWNVSCNLL